MSVSVLVILIPSAVVMNKHLRLHNVPTFEAVICKLISHFALVFATVTM